ncbi:PPOX class F420-dependent oxidoreductase [Streptomyces sp. NPDC007971]|uniref:pyridoxamine 5'-phosphate oxidase family protein n=1 Tax=unclassified Streptomyces TaxID=2593676 RepID=UPI003449BE0F
MTAMTSHSVDPGTPDEPYLAFWRERHLCTLTTLRPDGSPHVVPVGVTYDPEAGLARVITNGTSAKVSHIRAAGPGGARVAVCQVDGRRWATLEGRARVHGDADRVAEAERRYAERYHRVPGENPSRVVIEIEVERALGHG